MDNASSGLRFARDVDPLHLRPDQFGRPAVMVVEQGAGLLSVSEKGGFHDPSMFVRHVAAEGACAGESGQTVTLRFRMKVVEQAEQPPGAAVADQSSMEFLVTNL